MSRYYKFSQKHFEYELRGILMRNKCGYMEEITAAWIDEGNESHEYIYKISTRNKAVDIIVFSSVDMNQSKVRNIGADAVRLVLRWKTKKGYIYKRIAKHYRIETLFNNVEKSILKTQQELFSLNFKEFSSEY